MTTRLFLFLFFGTELPLDHEASATDLDAKSMGLQLNLVLTLLLQTALPIWEYGPREVSLPDLRVQLLLRDACEGVQLVAPPRPAFRQHSPFEHGNLDGQQPHLLSPRHFCSARAARPKRRIHFPTGATGVSSLRRRLPIDLCANHHWNSD